MSAMFFHRTSGFKNLFFAFDRAWPSYNRHKLATENDIANLHLASLCFKFLTSELKWLGNRQRPFDSFHGFNLIHLLLGSRSEEHTSELQSRGHLVCRLLLEKKK